MGWLETMVALRQAATDEPLGSIAILIAMASAAFTGGNFWMNARKDRRDVAATQPIFEFNVPEGLTTTGWITVVVGVTNRYPFDLKVETIEVLRPAGSLLMQSQEFVPFYYDREGKHTRTAMADLERPATRSIALRDGIVRAAKGRAFDLMIKAPAVPRDYRLRLTYSVTTIRKITRRVKVRLSMPAAIAPTKDA